MSNTLIARHNIVNKDIKYTRQTKEEDRNELKLK